MVASYCSCGPGGFNVTGELTKDIAKGQVGVTHARVGVAVAVGHQQVGAGLHGPAGELGQESRFAPPRTTSDKDYVSLARQRRFEEAVEARQLPLAGH